MTEDNNTKDPVARLTEAEVKAIEDSWNILYRKEHRKENGFKMIIKCGYYAVNILHISDL